MVGSYPSSSPSAIIPDDDEHVSDEDDITPVFQIPESLPAVAVSAATAFVMRIVSLSDPAFAAVNGGSGSGGDPPPFTFGGYSRRTF